MTGIVNVIVGVSVAGTVTEMVSGTGLDVSPVRVTVIVPSGVDELVGVRGAEVFEGATVLVGIGVRLEVAEGSAEG